jgi:2'-5' RNA ligase
MMLFPLDQMITNAATRGLWIGAVPTMTPDFADALEFMRDINGDVLEQPTPNLPHMTVAHFGRSNTRKTVELIHAALEVVCSTIYGEVPITIEGVLRLRMHLAFAVSPDFIRLRDQVLSALADRRINCDDTFAGIPHLTISKLKTESAIPRCAAVKKIHLRIPALTLVCGDAKIAMPFSEPPF